MTFIEAVRSIRENQLLRSPKGNLIKIKEGRLFWGHIDSPTSTCVDIGDEGLWSIIEAPKIQYSFKIAMRMLLEGKTMKSKCGFHFMYDEKGDLVCWKPLTTYANTKVRNIVSDELEGKWTEVD